MPPTDVSPRRRSLRVALLHLGDRTGGIHRYGRTVAEGMREVPGVEVSEHVADLAVDVPRAIPAALRAASEMAGADVSVVPYGRYGLWANGAVRLGQLAALHMRLRRRTVTVLHDVAEPGGADRVEETCIRLAVRLSGAVVVHGEHERARLAARGLSGRVMEVIPHFVERRELPDRTQARLALGLDSDDLALGIVGWIHPRKNYEAAIEALALLPHSARLVLVGGEPDGVGDYVDRLRRLADERGVGDRVQSTGYLGEDDLNGWLAALDVGLCPYRDASASGSFATLLSAGLPIVATDLPAFHAFAAPERQPARFVSRPTPEALARAVMSQRHDGGALVADDRSLHSLDDVARAYVERVFAGVSPV